MRRVYVAIIVFLMFVITFNIEKISNFDYKTQEVFNTTQIEGFTTEKNQNGDLYQNSDLDKKDTQNLEKIKVDFAKVENEKIKQYLEEYVSKKIEQIGEEDLTSLKINYDVHEMYSNVLIYKFSNNWKNKDIEIYETETLFFSKNNSQKLYFKDIFDCSDEILNKISQYIDSKIDKKYIYDINSYKKGIEPIYSNYNNFLFEDKNIIFYFNENQIGKNFNKIIEIKIPIDDFLNIFDAKTVLDTINNKSFEFDDEILNFKNFKYVSITFDDGPHSLFTSSILEHLKKYDAYATFFCLGSNISKNKELLEKMVENGHEIANHSFKHKSFVEISKEHIYEEISNTNTAILDTAGIETNLIRPPYGAINDNVLEIADQLKMPIVLWNLDPKDWYFKDSDKVSTHIIQNVKEGDIILLHDIYESSVEATAKILEDLTKKGFKFVTISDLKKIYANEKEEKIYKNFNIKK